MLKIENSSVEGWIPALRGMRNPMNSWDKADTNYHEHNSFDLGINDRALMEKLVKAGTDHRKFMRMLVVYVDVIAPLYWWKEFDTYKVGTVANSCSTMHRIHAKEFTLDDFSHEHLFEDDEMQTNTDVLQLVIDVLNFARADYLKTRDKRYWWQMIQLLPSSYNQRRTLMLNYEVLANIYRSRRNHKLDEWHTFCDWIETLPNARWLICQKEDICEP